MESHVRLIEDRADDTDPPAEDLRGPYGEVWCLLFV